MSAVEMELLRRGVSALRRSALWWAFGVACFGVVNVAFWPSFEGTDALTSLEDSSGALLEAFGGQNIATPAGYLDGQVFAVMLPLLLSGMAIATTSVLTSGDEDAGRLELLHALPVSRQAVWLLRFAAASLMVLAVSVVTAGLLLVSLEVFSMEEVSRGRVLGATLACAALAIFHGAVAYLVGAAGRSRGVAVGIAVLVLVVGYGVDFLFALSDALDGLRPLSPWYWAIGEQPVSNGVDLGWLAVLAGAVAALVGTGSIALAHRDIRSV